MNAYPLHQPGTRLYGGHYQRSTPRASVRIAASLREPAKPSGPVTVTDLSARGCRILTRQRLAPGTITWLRLPGLESWYATVVWGAGGAAGLDFDRPFHPAVADKLIDTYRTAFPLREWTAEMRRRFG
ncbi:PilZ domain-containing protein [Sphingosinicella sp. LY1275]|uniref:PilZ domain-containing protein n=1 Tax=Sphingosinicella sp. LY1275 TaxID=3095379 RepID=UPI002ADEF6C3|nr:PilZ domain-containing protein [Sphingosinicella sp. LY1275]MEA1014828.1 PilZ domain-containing protein [Sphingosinicella sp. LY1275]